MLGFIEKLTLRPDELTPADADAVRAAGVSDDALVDAIHVAALFNMIVRLADSLGWDVPACDASRRAPTRCSRTATRSTDPGTPGLRDGSDELATLVELASRPPQGWATIRP